MKPRIHVVNCTPQFTLEHGVFNFIDFWVNFISYKRLWFKQVVTVHRFLLDARSTDRVAQFYILDVFFFSFLQTNIIRLSVKIKVYWLVYARNRRACLRVYSHAQIYAFINLVVKLGQFPSCFFFLVNF